MQRILSFFKEDVLFSLSLLIALISCFFGRFSLESIDYKVIFCLFGLMLWIKNIEKIGILNYLADQLIDVSKTNRSLIRNITFLAFFSSMLLTNDVAILTLMPIYLTMTQTLPKMKNKLTGAILLIIAANLGSSFFPFGNPQNLFLFSHYKLALLEFFSWSWWLLVFSILLLSLSFLFISKEKISKQTHTMPNIPAKSLLYLVGIGICLILSIFNVFPYYFIIPITTILLVKYNPRMLAEVDYRLLWTFVFFFIAVGNFAQLDSIASFINTQFKTPLRTFLGSILLSQGISNVPAALLIAPFTKQAQALFLGVNVGGLGTIIASLANLIGFKLYKSYFPTETSKFLVYFFLINLGFLLPFIFLCLPLL